MKSYHFIRNWLPRIIILGAITVVALTLYALYQNVWQVFSSSKENLLLQNEVIAAELRVDLFRKIEENIKNKKRSEEINLENIKNPFGSVMIEEKIQIKQ